MSGFDTSQPIADDESLTDVDTEHLTDHTGQDEAAEKTGDAVDADELGDATPGPR